MDGVLKDCLFSAHLKLTFTDMVLAHFDSSQHIGISRDASQVGIGTVLFHHYYVNCVSPYANVSKTFMSTQRKYCQVQKETLSIFFAIKMFHKFLSVTDHKPFIVVSPNNSMLTLVSNRFSRWVLVFIQHEYSIEYSQVSERGNTDETIGYVLI